MARAASADPRLGTVVAGFRIVELLGRGGMSVVYRARDERLGRDVALKLLAPELTEDERFRRRFLHESRVAASLHHAGVVPVYGAGEADGSLWQAMRLVEGADLKALVRRERRLDPSRVLALLEQVAGALDVAHARGLVHRDVKPANILIEDAPPGERAYLADFGLAKADASGAGATATGQMVGTIDYVSPEQIRGQQVDGRADVYSLACVLYECLAGRPPFARRSDVAVLYAHLQDEPPPVSDQRPELPVELDSVVSRGLAKGTDDRPASAGQLIEEAQVALHHPARTQRDAARVAGPAAPPFHLIGRDRELRELRALLREQRLVTLVGAGGSGKTRLALELLSAAVDEYPDGAFWVPLQSLRDPAHVLPAIAAAVSAPGALAEHFGSRAALLVLDNFEQVAPAAAALGELLEAAPGVEVLVTSRQPLQLSLEQQYPLLPLAETDAVTLFVERARQVRPGFEPDDEVAELCRRLDGLPLAIELAAARVKLLSVPELLERMDRRLPLLTGGPRDAPERQRTLRATIEWSHDLLAPEEQTLFARLAVFLGGCTLEAAVDVCDAELDVLAALVDRSLVRREDERFGMLETIHEYAAERLVQSGEAETLRDRHAQHYLALWRELNDRRDTTRFELMDRVAREYPNTRAAYDWLVDSDPAAALELAIPRGGRWVQGEGIVEHLDRLEEALQRPSGASPTVRSRALFAVGTGLATVGRAEEAMASFEASLSLAEQAGAAPEIGYALIGVGRHEEALGVFRRLDDDRGSAAALHWLGLKAHEGGDLVRARELLEESVALMRTAGGPWNLAGTLHSLADCALDQGSIEEAARLYHESLDLAVPRNAFLTAAYCLGGLAAVEARRGRPASAARLWGVVERYDRTRSYPPLDDTSRSRYLRALSGVPLSASSEESWPMALADAVAYARSLEAENPSGLRA